ncbi:ribonuclease H [Niallia sp.]|uniref:ribonuclease H family protein n=1 Tax=Niallia sp. TaxID=2837523 RepID=UPI00289DB25E|nr:ribonuclease H [Niallia sp.]
MKELTIYLDGACSGNPGPGGWAAIIVDKGLGKESSISSFIKASTNNRMHLIACIEVLKKLKEEHKISLFCCSKYIVDCFANNWYVKWIENGWKNAKGKRIENQDLWIELLELIKPHSIDFSFISVNSCNPYIEECDRLAKLAIKQECDLNIEEHSSVKLF